MLASWGCRTLTAQEKGQPKDLERSARAGKSPVGEGRQLVLTDPEYGGTREMPSETGRTISQG
ncbi:hypothetical protein TK11N_24930 [Tetragenococcus koreensis]|uniref:Uncharacterized protein n=1 Tax=Tetragenococcus koreensis TaxID=290335 RepID=A0AAN4UDW7_9ENTE|nr:hypothetical protein TK11N_24930 [Tetragenococcus koreensis]GEQ53143.1 hypothetical protein TK12N_24870 [Tetragenococcus koreensis]GEQ55647.1 hypothetical protein TK2N_24910 [Tetragenococcus koreensis]GEQ58146.1 hypothetical protein TK4N_24890 [Tetragenococcus koreensis]GEQ60648.1 hypothetical protein TK6N_24870 [Tetragenococcus koreensis]